MLTAERLMLVGGAAAFVLTLVWVRSRDLREKYALVWLAVAAGLLVCGVFPDLVMRFADASRLAYPSAVLFVALAAIYVFSMSVSLSLSRQHRMLVRLVQDQALLRERLERVEGLKVEG